MGTEEQTVETVGHDTIDLEEELDEVDALLAADTVPVPPRGRSSRLVEFFLVGIANLVWGVVGLVLWFPQALRAVLGAVLRVIHSALTNQRSDRAIAAIKGVSSLYSDRFLGRRGEPVLVGRRHELRPFRLIGEAAWIAGFYLLVLRWLAPEVFQRAWSRLLAAWEVGAGWFSAAGVWLGRVAAGDDAPLTLARVEAGAVLMSVAVVAVLVGFWLGRRRG